MIRFQKDLGRVERALRRAVGGPLELRVPLDRHGSRIWELMDGDRTVLAICTKAAREFGEELEPVAPRVLLFLERLLLRNLIALELPEEGSAAPGRRRFRKPGNTGRTGSGKLDST